MPNNENIARQPVTVTPRVNNPNLTAVTPPQRINTTAPAIKPPPDPRQVSIEKVGPKARQAFGLKEGQTTATGLEKAIFIAGDAILKAQFAIDGVFYGKFQNVNAQNAFKRALDKGIVNVLDEISQIDLCQILNYAIEKTPGSAPFDPDSRPSGSFGSAKYDLQKKAYDVQKKIDGFYSSYLESEDPESKAKGVYEVIKEIKDAFKEINDPEAQSALRDPRILTAFPQMGPVNSFLEKAFADFNRYTDYRQIPSEDLQRQINNIDKTRQYAVLIQGLSTPASAISFVDTVFPNANIQEQIQKIQKLIDPARLMPLLKNIVESLKKIQSVCNVFLSFVTTAQGIIRIFTLIVKILKIVIKFLKALPIPNTFTVLGLTVTWASFTNKLERSIDQLVERLSQINILLSLVVGVVSQVVIILYDIIAKLNRMILSLEQCANADPQIIKDLQDATKNLQNTADYFTKFIENYNNKKNVESSTFGDYTISIVTEEVVDESIRLRRRYGIAQGKNGTIVAQSTPTFASDNQIIINEVKVKLSSLGLVQDELSLLDVRELGIITESLNFLMDEDISISNIEQDNFDNGLDSGNNENENEGLGLNAFVNKLQGGKKLRERMRKMMIKNSQQLQKDLKAEDTGGRFTGKLVKEAQTQENNLKIEQLQSEKQKLTTALIATPNPIGKAVILKKIKDIDEEIAKIKKQSQ